MADLPINENIEMDSADLYREEAITDRRVGSLQRLVPIKADGSDDDSRSVVFLGQTQVLTPAGALPLSFEIPAASLEEAVKAFGDHAKTALEHTMQRLEELRREQASSLIVPGGPLPGGSGGPGGAAGSGGGIQMP
jgi:hypothetical protein